MSEKMETSCNVEELSDTPTNQLTDSSTINQSVECTSTTTATATVKNEDEVIVTSIDSSADEKYETIEAIKHPHHNHNNQHTHHNQANSHDASNLKSMDKPSLNSSLNLLPSQKKKSRITTTIKLGVLQIVLSVVLSALGGLLIARNASLCMMGSGIWSGVIAGVVGSLGLMGLMNGFLAVSLISVATSTLGLALTGIGLIRDYNLSHVDQEIIGAYYAGLGLSFSLVLHLLTSMFSVYYSALRLCSNKQEPSTHDINIMNYQKVQDYLKSIQNAGPGSNAYFIGKDPMNTDSLVQGYANFVNSNNAKVYRQNSYMFVPTFNGMPPPFLPLYPPPPPSSYMSTRHYYNATMPHPHHHAKYHTHYERSKTMDNKEKRRKEKRQLEESEIKLSYTGLDRDIADNFLRQQEQAKQNSVKDEN